MKHIVFDLKDKEINKRCFILANGPSILNHNLSLLENEVTIGMNASTLLEKKFKFHQTYYVLSDKRFLLHEEKSKCANEKLSPLTIRVLRDILKEYDNNITNPTKYVASLGRDGFSFNLQRGFYFGSTTTMLAIQLAYYLGCKEIYILGLDLNYDSGKERFYKEISVQEYDMLTSVQLYNLKLAYSTLKDRNISLYITSKKSLARPYIDFVEYEALFK